jgi:hypothetical protein
MRTVAIASLLYAIVANPAAQNDPLHAARDLYASAAYEEALSEFTRLKSSLTAPGAAVEADQYRAFCLVALGRTTEAEGLAESLVRKDPMMTVGRVDASPRIEAMFATVRKRVLPQVIRDEYRIARSLATQKSPDAQSHLRDLQRMLTEAESIGAWDETLSDLRILVDGFLELSHAAASNSPPLVGAVVERADAKPSTPPPDISGRIQTGRHWRGAAGHVVAGCAANAARTRRPREKNPPERHHRRRDRRTRVGPGCRGAAVRQLGV